MGQRHQAFVIARIRPHSDDSSTPPKYRCIAAFHHQWCYGRLPLHATHRFIAQVKQKNNAEIIRSEIAAIQGKYGRWREKPALPHFPCPFTAFLLATNWSVDLEDPAAPYASGISFNNAALPADMGSEEGDNNDGISIIDVTDPAEPSYCFVSFNSIGGEEVRKPLSAEGYVRAYYAKYTPPAKAGEDETKEEATRRRNCLAMEEDVKATIAKLQDVKLIELGMLAEAWPAEYGGKGKRDTHVETEQLQAADTKVESDASNLPSLADITIPPAVLHAIQGGETADIEAMIWMPGKASAVKEILRQQSSFPDAGMMLLAKVIEKEREVDSTQLDLSGIPLSPTQLETFISPMESFDIVNLSHASTATVDSVRAVLTKFPQLKRLVLIECSSISSDDIRSLLDTEPSLFYRLEALVHPYFLGVLNDVADSCPYPNAFSYIGVHGNSLKACSLPLFTPSQVIQALIDTLGPLRKQFHSYSFLQTSFALQAAFSSVRTRGQKWSERETVIIPQLSLRAFKGEGWTFATSNEMWGGGNYYGFLRFTPIASDKNEQGIERMAEGEPSVIPALTWEIHDLASFVNRITLDGKPRPEDEAINQLQDILTPVETAQNMRLMDDEDVKTFIKTAQESIRNLY